MVRSIVVVQLVAWLLITFMSAIYKLCKRLFPGLLKTVALNLEIADVV